MINIGICDDEESYRTKIKDILNKISIKNNIGFNIYEYSSGESLVNEYTTNVDILILDIQMGEISGLEAAKNIRKHDDSVEIIFMTAYSEFMQDGYEVRAYRYLLKPIEDVKLINHIESCVKDIKNKRTRYLTLNTKNYINRIRIDSIVYIETQRPNILIHTTDNIYTTKMSMSKIEKELNGYGFFRCHNSFLINLKLIESMVGNEITINNEKIPVSKYRVKELKQEMTNVLGDIIC